MANNTFTQFFLKEIEAETVATRKCLERIPESAYSFKPHEKSMNMKYLVFLVAEIPKWILDMIEHHEINFATYTHLKEGNTAELVKQYDAVIDQLKKLLAESDDDRLQGQFSLKNGEQVLYSEGLFESVASTINHWVHHRGQLTVYMRLNDIAVPSIYGPSADEKGF